MANGIQFLKEGSIFTSIGYSVMLTIITETNNSKPNAEVYCQNKMLLLDDCVRSRTVAHTCEAIEQLGFELLEHPAQTPELLSPFDSHLLGALKHVLQGHLVSLERTIMKPYVYG